MLWSLILLLPLDIANSRGQGAGFDIKTGFMILFAALLLFIFVILPFVSNLYKADSEDSCCKRFFGSIFYTFASLGILSILGFICWKHFSNPQIECTRKIANFSNLEFIELKVTKKAIESIVTDKFQVPYKPNFIFVIIYFVLLIGWFFFVIFAGIGIVALPMDMILDFLYR